MFVHVSISSQQASNFCAKQKKTIHENLITKWGLGEAGSSFRDPLLYLCQCWTSKIMKLGSLQRQRLRHVHTWPQRKSIGPIWDRTLQPEKCKKSPKNMLIYEEKVCFEEFWKNIESKIIPSTDLIRHHSRQSPIICPCLRTMQPCYVSHSLVLPNAIHPSEDRILQH